MALFLKISLVQISTLSSMGMIIKGESMSKLTMKLLESCSIVSVAKLNESLTVYLLAGNGSKK